MLYHVPSGSKSSSSGAATGCVFTHALRSAITFQEPLLFTFATPFGTDGTPCEQPAPTSNAYISLPTKATSATPETRLPSAALVWLEGKLSATVVLTPWALIFEILPLVTLPRYGPAPWACSHNPTVETVPPKPPSATYKFPSGPNFNPRGLFKCSAKTRTEPLRATDDGLFNIATLAALSVPASCVCTCFWQEAAAKKMIRANAHFQFLNFCILTSYDLV